MPVSETMAMRLRRAYMTMHRYAQQHFASFGVTADQYVLLSLLAEQDEIRQQDLAARAYSDPNTIAAMLSLLEEKKLLRRKRDKSDGRAKLVCLTALGHRLHEKLIRSVEPIHAEMERAVGADRQALFASLWQIESTLANLQLKSSVDQ
ncbi:MarR family winged helix-turn-helix transcriptional regulator [Adhaeretor mobilis]|uniref:Transcriptional regulator HosA n=1 Tax=Adhaeretor mobilis TaxID=1930276 RepID=A0A517N2W0_9BACT|nr:MarR family transcriptional regulator [Adhaeretor mobilis]QDT01469.1 Transcriptional regulator HosA [Adhaeretor mobilis]